MRAPDWYEAWCEEAFAAFTAKQARLEETYRLSGWHRYDYDIGAGTLTFSDEGGPKVSAEIEVVGSTGEDGWMWAWASPGAPDIKAAPMREVAAFGAEHRIEELTTGHLHGDDAEEIGWMLSAIAARILNAEGAYSVPLEGGRVFLLIRSIRLVS